MIVPIIQARTRHLLNVKDEGGGLGTVEVIHLESEVERRILVRVQTDEDDVRVTFEQKMA